MNKLIITIILPLSIIVAACTGSRNDFSGYCNLPVDGWAYGDTLTFVPCHPDTVADGSLVLSLRHDNSYLFSNLWLEISYDDVAGHRVDTVNVQLCDVYGHWFGHGIGARYQLSDTVTGRFRHLTSTPVRVRHIMRVDTLRGIEQLGVAFIQ